MLPRLFRSGGGGTGNRRPLPDSRAQMPDVLEDDEPGEQEQKDKDEDLQR